MMMKMTYQYDIYLSNIWARKNKGMHEEMIKNRHDFVVKLKNKELYVEGKWLFWLLIKSLTI